jgi:hypothetical protein
LRGSYCEDPIVLVVGISMMAHEVERKRNERVESDINLSIFSNQIYYLMSHQY